MNRPVLTHDLPAAEFQQYYWLKAELLAFCRAHNLGRDGSKADLTARIMAFLTDGRTDLPSSARRPPARPMPTIFTPETRIETGWRCTQPLREFFRSQIGQHFRFDHVMRTFIAEGTGKTLQEAIEAWNQPRQRTTIAPQFEYNRHMRAFFEAYPDATREEAIQAWNMQRTRKRPAPEHDERDSQPSE